MRLANAATWMLVCAFAVPTHAEPQRPTPNLSVARIVSSLPEGQTWGTLRHKLCLALQEKLAWGVGAGRLNVSAFEQPAREELKREGFKIAGDLSNPFEKEVRADLVVGGTITGINGDFCIFSVAPRVAIKGNASIDVKWQVYSNLDRQVVASLQTTGVSRSETPTEGGFQSILIGALDDSLRAFTASDTFKHALTSAPSSLGPSNSEAKEAIRLSGSAAANATRISDAVGSVVLILSGGGHGSGFLVSTDGYLMTAAHVIGSDKYVKVRWSDGLEGIGEVVRSDRRRDVALIKADPRGRQPLGLRRIAPQSGDTVFAIGAPIDPKLQNTVTRGVVSANRIIDGFSFIQSDVTVDPGNSGGPLLDEKGQVLGFTDIGIRTAEAPTGLNFFVPIDDALRFLSAEPR